MALIGSELSSDSYDGELPTISDKDSAFAWSNKDSEVLAIINIHIGCDIKDKITTVFTVIDVVLLFFDRVYFLDFKGIGLVFEAIVIRVVFFLDSFRFEDVGVEFWRLLNRFRCLLLFL